MVEETVAPFGGLDAAYNNAGVQNIVAETTDATREDYDNEWEWRVSQDTILKIGSPS